MELKTDHGGWTTFRDSPKARVTYFERFYSSQFRSTPVNPPEMQVSSSGTCDMPFLGRNFPESRDQSSKLSSA